MSDEVTITTPTARRSRRRTGDTVTIPTLTDLTLTVPETAEPTVIEPADTVPTDTIPTVTVPEDTSGTTAVEEVAPVQTWSYEEFRGILVTPRTKDSVPTLTCIDRGFYKRYFILEVEGDAYKAAWDYYRRTVPGGTPDEFVTLVMRTLDQGMPRMHRAVSYVPLG